MRIRVLLNRLIPPINALERKLIAVVADSLAPEARSLFTAQVAAINYVQRHSKGKEVNLYSMRGKAPHIEPSLLFPLRHPETRLATLEFLDQDRSQLFRVVFWLTGGQFFSIEYNQSPKHVRADRISINKIRILVDPMKSDSESTAESINVTKLTGWLKDWAKSWALVNLRKPLSKDTRGKIIEQFGYRLPNDYEEITAQTEGLKVQDCVIFGLSQIRSVVLPRRNYYVLAEFEGHGALGVAQDGDDRQIWFFDYEDGRPEPMGLSFRAAVERKLGEKSVGSLES